MAFTSGWSREWVSKSSKHHEVGQQDVWWISPDFVPRFLVFLAGVPLERHRRVRSKKLVEFFEAEKFASAFIG